MTDHTAPAWGPERSRALYHIAHWGDGYFDVNGEGHLVAHPDRRPEGPAVDLYELVSGVHAAGLSLPVLVRFTDILRDRTQRLVTAFRTAMTEAAYRGHYTAVYPIKVNQQRRVVEQILAVGETVGLEAGSKPELMAVLALSHRGGLVVCNGYKDREYIRLALLGERLGVRTHIVVEKPSELSTVMTQSAELGIRPRLGVRVRLSSIGAGKWQNTGGEKAKFGLEAAQVLALVERLRTAGLLDCLVLMHFHLGSQVANIRDIQNGLREAARYYAELHRLGAPITTVDVGGGLGVDYEGTSSRSFCSINYSLQEYANNVVHAFAEVCAKEEGLPHPDLVTESGRAMTAHHAVLLTHVIDIERAPEEGPVAAPAPEAPAILHNLWRGLASLDAHNALEIYHDAVHWYEEIQSKFDHGLIDLAQRAAAERLYTATCTRVRRLLISEAGSRRSREVLDELNERQADKYFCNFSLFQSIPDAWAIQQVFPVVPLHRLNEQPTRRAVIEDLTCDSDGRINHYVDAAGVESSLPLHPWEPEEPYLLGIFLVGAYQEILGDIHNLFGDTNAVNVELTNQGTWRLVEPIHGDTVTAVLGYVHFDARTLLTSLREKLEIASETARETNGLSNTQVLAELAEGLEGYTYLEK
ncbi:arginine decarboxylase, biosynthetic [Gammaproteobacteria bacterium]